MLKKYDLTANDLTLVDIPPENVLESLGKYIDAGHTWAPFDLQAVEMGHRVLFTTEDMPTLFPDLVDFRNSFLETRGQDASAFLAAVLEAVDYWLANPQRGSALIAEYISDTVAPMTADEILLQGIKLYTLQENVELFQQETRADSVFDTAGITLEYMVRSGSLTHLPDLELLLMPSYLGAVKGE